MRIYFWNKAPFLPIVHNTNKTLADYIRPSANTIYKWKKKENQPKTQENLPGWQTDLGIWKVCDVLQPFPFPNKNTVLNQVWRDSWMRR